MEEEVRSIGMDLAKRSLQVRGATADGSVAYRKKVIRGKLLSFLASHPGCKVAMEACVSAHYWGREVAALGHEVKLVAPIYVKPLVKRGKNDAADAQDDHGSGAASDQALRGGQDQGAAGAGDALSQP